ncbi:MAG: M43 family zinc metalloprotease [Saprospiraceae bacterium]|nr:M43 family zinc metalloprotease [Saprospiraceae bacterium]
MLTLKQTLGAILLVSLSPISVAQNAIETYRNCGSMPHLEKQIAEYPEITNERARIEAQTQDYIRRTPSVSQRSVLTIPVVVHVLYNTVRENISDAQIQSQIDALNRDFRKMNAEVTRIPTDFQSIAADVNIEFCLAKRQPNGLPTTGIERLRSTNTSWQANDDMKLSEKGGLNAWDASKYLNIWVCSLNGGALGYATFPGSPLSTDGVVIDYRYFGTYNTRAPFHLGRTTTHEVGHWLNLFHIWGDGICGDDHCDDTPKHQGANYGCPTYPLVRTNCGGSNVEMTMNFMDYTNDACMYLFTNSQKARMLSLFAVGSARRGFVEANLCGFIPPPVCAVPTNLSISNISAQSVTVAWTASADNATFTIEYRRISDSTWTSAANLTANSFVINGLQSSTTYQLRLRSRCTNAIESSDTPILTAQTLEKIIIPPSPPLAECTDVFEPNNSSSVASKLESTIKITGMIADYRDRDWFRLDVPAGTSIKINLSNLPADYDIRLFDNRFRLVQTSENQGNADENLTYTTSAGQDFLLIYIYGYNAAFHPAKCYALEIKSFVNGTQNVSKSNLRKINVKKADYTEGVILSPNPTSGVVNIELPTANKATIQVFNILGQLVLTSQNDAYNQLTIDLYAANNGVYFVKIEQDRQVWTKKIVKN